MTKLEPPLNKTVSSDTDALADGLAAKAEASYATLVNQCHVRADRTFLWLMIAQWVFGIVMAVVVSPIAWDGKTSAVSNHIYAAVLLGGLLSAMPIALILLRPGWAGTRYVVAFSQMMWSALLIHLTGGRIETHFHVFGSLAFVAFYRDWKVLAIATVVVAADHFTRGLLMPESVYGIANPSIFRFLEHAAWVVFEVLVLLLSVRQGLAELRRIAENGAQIEALFQGLSPAPQST